MRYAGRRWMFPVAMLAAWVPAAVWAGGGEKQGQLVHVADTRGLEGFNLFLANLYNTDRVLFTLVTLAVTAVMGVVLGYLMDLIVNLIGLDLGAYEGRE